MTQNEKDLLLQDLCARLPYGVKGEKYTIRMDGEFVPLIDVEIITAEDIITLNGCPGYTIKPYLFPLSNMTEEQESYLYFNTKFKIDMFGDLVVRVAEDDNYCYTDIIDYASLIDWLNKNHFDYRGLIEKGLAIDATRLNIY